MWLDENLDAAALTRWAGKNEARLELLREIGQPCQDADEGEIDEVELVVGALEALEQLDDRIVEAIVALVAMETDPEIRQKLLWALTHDDAGRLLTGETLHARVSDRLADARASADAFDELLETAGETQVQAFLENNPWLLGLDYAQIRARQPVVRGAVDFLLERFDGSMTYLNSRALTIRSSRRKDGTSTSGRHRPSASADRSPWLWRRCMGIATCLARRPPTRSSTAYLTPVSPRSRF